MNKYIIIACVLVLALTVMVEGQTPQANAQSAAINPGIPIVVQRSNNQPNNQLNNQLNTMRRNQFVSPPRRRGLFDFLGFGGDTFSNMLMFDAMGVDFGIFR